MAHINVYNQDELIRITAQFSTADGTPADPSTVTLMIKDPAGEITTRVYNIDPEVIKVEVGSYQCDHLANAPGRWYYSWYGTGAVQISAYRSFFIRRSPFG